MGRLRPVTGQRLFVPGFAVRGTLYAPGLPPGWRALEPPSPRMTGGRLEAYRSWLVEELVRRSGAAELAGHSLGAALAIAAAADRPELVGRLTLFSPAGLPLAKPMADSLVLLVRQALGGLYPPPEVAVTVARTLRAPLATLRLAREAHDLDLSAEARLVAAAGIPSLVVGCESDTLTTPAVCRSIAAALGGAYEQVDGAGHMWMLRDRRTFQAVLSRRAG
jgi:pimeloyl-ACP methyl ester carboxylesterase